MERRRWWWRVHWAEKRRRMSLSPTFFNLFRVLFLEAAHNSEQPPHASLSHCMLGPHGADPSALPFC